MVSLIRFPNLNTNQGRVAFGFRVTSNWRVPLCFPVGFPFGQPSHGFHAHRIRPGAVGAGQAVARHERLGSESANPMDLTGWFPGGSDLTRPLSYTDYKKEMHREVARRLVPLNRV